MQINWFTLLAQIVNFVILLFLLRRFLYKPILETMDQREQMIAAKLQDAEQKRAEAEQEAEQYRQQQQELDEKREEKLTEIHKEADARRKELLDKAQQEVEKKKQGWLEAVRREQDSFLQELRLRVGHEAAEVARRALQDLAGVQVERRIVDNFLSRIQALEADEIAEISGSVQKSNQAPVIRSSFELPDEVQQSITAALQDHLLWDGDRRPRFEIQADLISGVELQVGGYRVAWTIRDYLNGLEAEIEKALAGQERAQHEAKNVA